MSIHQELQEFYDGIDGTEELDDLNEKIKDMQFKVSKKDKRKTKIEDQGELKMEKESTAPEVY